MSTLQAALQDEVSRRETELETFRKALEAMGGSSRSNGQARRSQARRTPQNGSRPSAKDALLKRLSEGPASPAELKAIAGSSYAYHMPRLKKAGIVKKVRGSYELKEAGDAKAG